VPVEILNTAFVAFAATVTDAGAVRTPEALLVNVTTAPPAGATCESVTVHVVLPLEDNVGPQDSALMPVVGCSVMVALALVAFTVPVSVAV
jgi:hypothetical protein